MSFGLNECAIGGYLTDDVKCLDFEAKDGKEATSKSFGSLGVSRPTKEKQSDFIDFEAWGKNAELLFDHGTKGKPFILCGEIRKEKYQTKEGKDGWKTFLYVTKVRFVPDGNGKKTEGGSTEGGAPSGGAKPRERGAKADDANAGKTQDESGAWS